MKSFRDYFRNVSGVVLNVPVPPTADNHTGKVSVPGIPASDSPEAIARHIFDNAEKGKGKITPPEEAPTGHSYGLKSADAVKVTALILCDANGIPHEKITGAKPQAPRKRKPKGGANVPEKIAERNGSAAALNGAH
jgi:hypothetical protein